MAFQVDWTPSAQNALASLWIIAADRQGMSGAVNQIERCLAADPTKGHDLAEGLYKFCVPPVTVYYEIGSVTAIVTVTAISLSPI